MLRHEFFEPSRVGAYDTTVENDATAVVCARTEEVYKDNLANSGTYKTVQRETAQFILAVVEDTWVRELQETETFYTDVTPKTLLIHLQAGCTGRHALCLLALHNEMQRYHLEAEGIPDFINIIEDAHKQAGRDGRAIANETIILFARTEMLTTEGYSRTNNNWEY